ncbi:uncharacterized protein LOC129599482 isoform X2 [Paramacrobiotus metropolitanus]|uniref:uncharacterized protein LOC129599482 isoform X2 n=1 Tax=Paramacrobiotus metropolitanus TaxID=2943436 RepID=UPI002446262D|nr:uncharacterized protein LOC129599482 isoform X2 [Paramacrobiotus metropolitanus]
MRWTAVNLNLDRGMTVSLLLSLFILEFIAGAAGQVQTSGFNPINCYFCDTNLDSNCDGRVEELVRQAGGAPPNKYSGPCKWVAPKPFTNNLIGLPLRPYCVTFIELLKSQGKVVSDRMVRDCAHPGGSLPPPDCLRYDDAPNAFLWRTSDWDFRNFWNWGPSDGFVAIRTAVFCNSSDNCNTIKRADLESRCDFASLRSLDVSNATANNSALPVGHGRTLLPLGLLISLALSPGRMSLLPLSSLAVVTLLASWSYFAAAADLYKWTAPTTLQCYSCGSWEGSSCTSGQFGSSQTGYLSSKTSSVIDLATMARLRLVQRLDPVCVTYVATAYRNGQLFDSWLERRNVYMEVRPNECMNITDFHAKHQGVAGYSRNFIALFCWSNLCNTLSQSDVLSKCYTMLGQAGASTPDLSATQVTHGPVVPITLPPELQKAYMERALAPELVMKANQAAAAGGSHSIHAADTSIVRLWIFVAPMIAGRWLLRRATGTV